MTDIQKDHEDLPACCRLKQRCFVKFGFARNLYKCVNLGFFLAEEKCAPSPETHTQTKHRAFLVGSRL